MGKHQRGEIENEEFLWRMNELGIHMSVISGNLNWNGSQKSDFIPAEELTISFEDNLSYEDSLTVAREFDRYYNSERKVKEELMYEINQLSSIAVLKDETLVAYHYVGTYEEPPYYLINGIKVRPGLVGDIIEWWFPTVYAPGDDDVQLRKWVEERGGSVTPNYNWAGRLTSVSVKFGDVSHDFNNDDYYIMNDRTYISEAKIFDVFGTTGVGAAKPYEEVKTDIVGVYVDPQTGNILDVIYSNGINCYAFAIGSQENEQPGKRSNHKYDEPHDVDTIANYVIEDLETQGRKARIIEGKDAPILPTERRIATRVSTNKDDYDYHFMVQFSDNTWGEKHGKYDLATDGRSVQHNKNENPDNILWDSSYGAMDGFYDSKIVYIAIID